MALDSEELNFVSAQIWNCVTVGSYGGDIESDQLGRSRLTECRADSQEKDARVSAHK